jgi:biopolymer transport protein TolR
MAFSTGSVRGPRSDINVTPLVDVVLVLLIIFMVVTPLLHRGKDVRLPVAKNAAEEQAGTGPVVVSITADKALYWGTDRVDLEEIASRLSEAMSKKPDTKMLLKADQSLSVGDVRPVLERVRSMGVKDVMLAADNAAHSARTTRRPR